MMMPSVLWESTSARIFSSLAGSREVFIVQDEQGPRPEFIRRVGKSGQGGSRHTHFPKEVYLGPGSLENPLCFLRPEISRPETVVARALGWKLGNGCRLAPAAKRHRSIPPEDAEGVHLRGAANRVRA